MQQPEGYTDLEKQGRVWRLLKALYDLKQAPREWWLELDKFLKSLGYNSSLHFSELGIVDLFSILRVYPL